VRMRHRGDAERRRSRSFSHGQSERSTPNTSRNGHLNSAAERCYLAISVTKQ
jgi:hypothetical protein